MQTRILLYCLIVTMTSAAEPEKLMRLRGSYESAVAKATAPLQKTYITELGKLKIEFTRSGNLEAAIAVDEELKRVSTPSATSLPSDSEGKDRKRDRLIKFLCDGQWRNMGASVYGSIFHLDGKFESLDPEGKLERTGAWKVKDDETIELDLDTAKEGWERVIPIAKIDQKLKKLTVNKPDGTHHGDWMKK